ncbi:hypothetical protein [Winogradskyella sp.]|uniref:hypothetical protein n=1 Tax=Winogradskyella sp. TaxID=1883156 RepID=UPI00260388DB|nr:hypothetical protein [Winogradskyella sp.]
MRIFKEEQRFTQSWRIIIIILSMMVPLGIIVGIYTTEPQRLSSLEFVLIAGLIILASGIIFLFKLSSRIDELGIHYRFFPFHQNFKLIRWNEINSVYVRTYNAISEYGGWGLKGKIPWKKSKGAAINVSGNVGIQLELKNGKKILIGTKKQKEAKATLETYKEKIIKSKHV